MLYDFGPLQFTEICFVAQNMVCLGELYIYLKAVCIGLSLGVLNYV